MNALAEAEKLWQQSQTRETNQAEGHSSNGEAKKETRMVAEGTLTSPVCLLRHNCSRSAFIQARIGA